MSDKKYVCPTPNEEERTSFETTKMALEEGFRIEGNGYNSKFYLLKDYTHIHHIYKIGFLDEEETDETICDCHPVKVEDRLYAPTLTQLQTWLRETHKIHIIVQPSKNFDGSFSSLGLYSVDALTLTEENGKIVRDVICSTACTSYEEALESGLQKGLMIIQWKKH